VLDRLALMRILSALIAGLTAMFAALFVMELMPGARWAAAGGGLVVALQPMAGFIGGGVNGDVLLYAASAGLFYALARIFRRGLDVHTGAVLGAVLFAGLFAKLTFEALVPMAVLGLALGAWRSRANRADVLKGVGIAVLVGLIPFAIYYEVQDALRVDLVGPPDATALGPRSTQEALSYIWQLYLPRLPWMDDLLPEFPLYTLWFKGLVGRFGWLDYSFPGWVNRWALIPFFAVVAAALWGAWRARRALWARLPELAVYASGVAVLLFVIGWFGYGSLKDTGARFEQARYVLPLLALWAAFVALGLRGLGRRWGPVAAAVLVVIAASHSLLAQLLTLGRYYG